jgi:hypothetical protein
VGTKLILYARSDILQLQKSFSVPVVTAQDRIHCSNAVFGSDPSKGSSKSCYIMSTGSTPIIIALCSHAQIHAASGAALTPTKCPANTWSDATGADSGDTCKPCRALWGSSEGSTAESDCKIFTYGAWWMVFIFVILPFSILLCFWCVCEVPSYACAVLTLPQCLQTHQPEIGQ